MAKTQDLILVLSISINIKSGGYVKGVFCSTYSLLVNMILSKRLASGVKVTLHRDSRTVILDSQKIDCAATSLLHCVQLNDAQEKNCDREIKEWLVAQKEPYLMYVTLCTPVRILQG